MRKRDVMNKDDMERALTRISHEILEANKGCKDLVIVGIRTRGVYLAGRIAKKIKDIEGDEIPTGIIDITLYRDDLRNTCFQPEVKKTEMPFSVDEKNIILVDDVLYTGRSIRAAIDVLMDLGRPNIIKLAVLIDRGHRELPIKADFIGKSAAASRKEVIEVMLIEEDGIDMVAVRDE